MKFRYEKRALSRLFVINLYLIISDYPVTSVSFKLWAKFTDFDNVCLSIAISLYDMTGTFFFILIDGGYKLH